MPAQQKTEGRIRNLWFSPRKNVFFFFFFPRSLLKSVEEELHQRWVSAASSSTVWSFSSDLLTNTNAHQPITVNGRTNWANHMHLSLLRVFFFFFPPCGFASCFGIIRKTAALLHELPAAHGWHTHAHTHSHTPHPPVCVYTHMPVCAVSWPKLQRGWLSSFLRGSETMAMIIIIMCILHYLQPSLKHLKTQHVNDV